MEITKKSLELTQLITETIHTFHHHYHILYDIANSFEGEVNYLEIGAYAGGSASLVLQRPNTKVFSIDLGEPVPKEQVLENVSRMNILENKYEYIQGNSQLEETKKELLKKVKKVDLFYIDGDHSAVGVKADFYLYQDMVKVGGYIVFDDYNDPHSPEVKPAVTEILSTLEGWEIIGTIHNEHGARPDWLKEGNCFVIKRVK